MTTLEELSKKKAEIKNKIQTEDDLLDLLFEHIDLLTCFNCGNKIIRMGFGDRKLCELYIDIGTIGYPYEPDVPASLYFICAECAKELERGK